LHFKVRNRNVLTWYVCKGNHESGKDKECITLDLELGDSLWGDGLGEFRMEF